MRKYLEAAVVAGLVALVSAAALAASPPVFRPDAGTGWATPYLPYYRESVATVQIPGTETAPSSASDGFEVKNANPYDLHVEVQYNPTGPADDAGTCTTSTSGDKDANAGVADNLIPTMWLRAYVYNPGSGKWSKAPDLDQKVTGGSTTWAKTGIVPPTSVSRVAYIHSTTGSACPLKVYVISR